MPRLPPVLNRQLVEGHGRHRIAAPRPMAPVAARRPAAASSRGASRPPPDPGRPGQGPDAAGPVFRIDRSTDLLGRLAARIRGPLVALGNLETRLLADEIAPICVERPIFIAGLARAGTTILLESLERHPDTASHRYRDFPMLLAPVAWNRLLDRMPRSRAAPQERAHRDGIEVTAESPEAFEEMLWMSFFPALHAVPPRDHLDADTHHPAFERFFSEHVRKLLWLRGGRRYLSKANYNLSRLGYLLRLFPDARIVIPVRDPVWHIASLMKQHRLFCAGQGEDPRALRHFQRVGHFEFGLDRRPIAGDDPDAARAVMELWRNGREVEGWALYWAHLHGYILRCLERNPRLRDATLILRHEDLCGAPRATMDRVLAHCGLAATESFSRSLARRLHAPTYYRPAFSDPELAIIRSRTGGTARRFGYLEPAAAMP